MDRQPAELVSKLVCCICGLSLSHVRLLVRSSEHYLHGTVLASMLFGEKKSTVSVDNVDDIMKEVGHVMGVSGFRLVHAPSLAKDLLHMDEVRRGRGGAGGEKGRGGKRKGEGWEKRERGGGRREREGVGGEREGEGRVDEEDVFSARGVCCVCGMGGCGTAIRGVVFETHCSSIVGR